MHKDSNSYGATSHKMGDDYVIVTANAADQVRLRQLFDHNGWLEPNIGNNAAPLPDNFAVQNDPHGGTTIVNALQLGTNKTPADNYTAVANHLPDDEQQLLQEIKNTLARTALAFIHEVNPQKGTLLEKIAERLRTDEWLAEAQIRRAPAQNHRTTRKQTDRSRLRRFDAA
jgi:hypothetical protein